MEIESIFDSDLDKIDANDVNNIQLIASSIKIENYPKLIDKLKSNPKLENIFITYSKGSKEFWNNFFNTLKKGGVDLSKIVLSGDVENADLDIFQDIKRLELSREQIGHISTIRKKFPNLESIQSVENVRQDDVGGNIKNLIDFARYTKTIHLNYKEIRATRSFIKKGGLEDTVFISDDSSCIVNKDRLQDVSRFSQNLSINARDIEKIGIENLKNSEDSIVLIAQSVAELPYEKIQEYKSLGLNISAISIYSKENTELQNESYSLETYLKISEKLQELVEGIDLNAPEKERFAEVYKRVCESIIYDYPAAYPNGTEEEQYSKQEETNCRNLKNGLLEGKCVCAGYADILRNALSLVNIEAEYISGEVPSEKEGKEGHAWNTVKLDGVWYNVDATWDSSRIRAGHIPANCLKSDEDIKKYDEKEKYNGQECSVAASEEEIEELFASRIVSRNENAPRNVFLNVLNKIKEIGQNAANDIKELRNKIFNYLSKNNLEMLDQGEKENVSKPIEKSNPWDIRNWEQHENYKGNDSRNVFPNKAKPKEDKDYEDDGWKR